MKKSTFLLASIALFIISSCNTRIEEDYNTNTNINNSAQIKSIELKNISEKYDFVYTDNGSLQSISNNQIDKKGVFLYDTSHKLISIQSNKMISEFNYSGDQLFSITSKTIDGKIHINRNLKYLNGGNTIQIETTIEGSNQRSIDIFQFENGNLISASLDGVQLKYYYDNKINPFNAFNKETALLEGFSFGNFGGNYQISRNNVIKIEQKNNKQNEYILYKNIENIYDDKGKLIKIISQSPSKEKEEIIINYN